MYANWLKYAYIEKIIGFFNIKPSGRFEQKQLVINIRNWSIATLSDSINYWHHVTNPSLKG